MQSLRNYFIQFLTAVGGVLAIVTFIFSVDLAIFMIRTTIEAQRLTVGLRGTGGPIDVAVITRGGMRFVQKKEIKGEEKRQNYEHFERSC